MSQALSSYRELDVSCGIGMLFPHGCLRDGSDSNVSRLSEDVYHRPPPAPGATYTPPTGLMGTPQSAGLQSSDSGTAASTATASSSQDSDAEQLPTPSGPSEGGVTQPTEPGAPSPTPTLGPTPEKPPSPGTPLPPAQPPVTDEPTSPKPASPPIHPEPPSPVQPPASPATPPILPPLRPPIWLSHRCDMPGCITPLMLETYTEPIQNDTRA